MRRAGALRRLTLSVVLVATAAVGLGGCILAPIPTPVAVGPPVVVGPRPVIIAPRPHGFYRGGYRGGDHHWR